MRIVVVGLGIQGNKRSKFAGKDLVATVDPFKSGVTCASIEQVPVDSYDAALVCTPDEQKQAIMEYLLTRKKHVLVEKPVLGSESDLASLKRLAKEHGVALYVAYNHRFEPHFVRLRELIAGGTLGKLYLLRTFYGNGTARDVRNSDWRDKGMGVVSDIGSHLIDSLLYFFDGNLDGFRMVSRECFENSATDYFCAVSSSGKTKIQIEASLLAWRNTFTLDLFGENGTAHISCLCKWGPSAFTVRGRVLPSGKPPEETVTLECRDPTWEAEYMHFKKLCQTGAGNIDDSIFVNRTLNQLFMQAQ